MTRNKMIRDLEYVNGGISSVLTICVQDDKWRELLDTWSTIISSVIDNLEDDDDEGV